MSCDPFKGSDDDLIDSINALIGLNAADALTPRIPRMAIDLLTSAAIRFAPGPAASSTLASGNEQVTAPVVPQPREASKSALGATTPDVGGGD